MDFKKGNFLQYVINNKKPIYCASSLFSPLGRIGGANLAVAVEYEINAFLSENNIDISSSDLVFLPFRDTNQTTIIGANRSRQIYEADINQLVNSSALLARLDGLAKDSGVAMEVGYAFGLNIPIGILLTDFIWEGLSDSEIEWNCDPIIQQMSDVCESTYKLCHISKSYYKSNLISEEYAVRKFVQKCLEFKRDGNKNIETQNIAHNNKCIYIDFMGGRYEWARYQQNLLKHQLEKYDLKVYTPKRYEVKLIRDQKNIFKFALEDIHNAINSSIAIFSGDAPEMDAGSAAIFGLCTALKKLTIFQYSSPIYYTGEGGQKMKTNLMIEQASRIVTSSQTHTFDTLEKIINKTFQ